MIDHLKKKTVSILIFLLPDLNLKLYKKIYSEIIQNNFFINYLKNKNIK